MQVNPVWPTSQAMSSRWPTATTGYSATRRATTYGAGVRCAASVGSTVAAMVTVSVITAIPASTGQAISTAGCGSRRPIDHYWKAPATAVATSPRMMPETVMISPSSAGIVSRWRGVAPAIALRASSASR